jgi:hypothetical protein
MEKLKGRLGIDDRNIVVLYLLMGVAAVIGIVSGIGATCVTFFPVWWELSAFSVVERTQIFFIASYIVTWIVAIVWCFLYFVLQRGKTWFYNVALINSIAGIISGFIPCWILLYEDYQSFGESGMKFTPSWFRVIANLVLLIFLIIPKFKREIKAFLEERSVSPGASVGSEVSRASFVLFGIGIVFISYAIFILPMTHILWSSRINFEQLLFICGLFCNFLGLLTLSAGRLINVIHSKTKSVES